MIRGTIDPGSRWLAATISADDSADLPLRYVDARVFEIGRYVAYPVPQIRRKKPKTLPDGTVEPGDTYEAVGERVLTEADASEAATRVVAYLLAHHVEEVVVEHVKNLFGTVPAVGTELLKSSGVYTRIVDRLEQRGIRVRYVLAATWRARLTPLVKASIAARGGTLAGVAIKAKGTALEPVVAAHVEGWPGRDHWTAEELPHVLDSTGLALACALPALLGRVSKAPCARGPRVKRASKAQPRGSRARGKMGPIDLEKSRRLGRLQVQRWRAKKRPALIESRAAAGCSCRAPGASLGGRHKASCPMHKSKGTTAAATCPKCHRLGAVHPRPGVCPVA